MMATEASPTRLGITELLVPRFAAAGWIGDDGLVVHPALDLLQAVRRGPEPEAALDRIIAILEAAPELADQALTDPGLGHALVAITGSSRTLSVTVRTNPGWLRPEEEPVLDPPSTFESFSERLTVVRRFVRRRLLWIAVRDLLGQASMPEVGRDLADTADAAAAGALAAVDQEVRLSPTFTDLPPIPFSVIAMGKWGGQELNYSSDIDVLFVYDTPTGADPELARRYATKTATEFMAALGEVTPEGAAFRVDADLRPEGKNGPLARSIDSYAGYYDKWAQTWEFQSLIKARPAAGDPHLGERFTQLIAPHVYPDTLNPDAIRAIRTMKARIERERLGAGEDPDFHLKLGRGGMNDIEFLTQLHQMRFGGRYPELRTPGTEIALEMLTATKHLSSSEAGDLIQAYRFCGTVRNRLFLQYGRPIDSLPTDQDELTRLALSLGRLDAPRSSVREEYRRLTRRARRLIERLFYQDS